MIQRKGSHSVTYQQNVIVRFLQPPPIPTVGPLVIKEVNMEMNWLTDFIGRFLVLGSSTTTTTITTVGD